jgi:hypothetical protein
MDEYAARKRQLGGGFNLVIPIAVGDAAKVLFAVKQPVDTGDVQTVAKYTIHVQRIEMVIVTGSGGKTWSVGNSTDTATDLTGTKSAATSNTRYTYDFGPQGTPLTEDNDLEFFGVAGAVGYIVVEGFQSQRVVAPDISLIDPATGTAAGGDSVNIDVWPNEQGLRVFFGTTEATVVSYGDYFVTVTTPAHAAGAVDVTVHCPSLLKPIIEVAGFTFT